MKTLEIKDVLKEDLLVVELPDTYDLDWVTDKKHVKAVIDAHNHFEKLLGNLVHSYTLLGKLDEISEKDAAKIVQQSIHTGLFAHYVKGIPVNIYCYKTAIKSFNSALESEIYWNVNPFESKADSLVSDNSANGCALYRKAFHEFCEAEEKTFDRKRTLIFVKN